MYAGFRLPNAFLLSALKSPFRAFRQAPFIGCLVACGLLAPCPPATAGGFRHPPASARRSRVLPSVICRQGLRKCLSAPLPSVPSVSPSAPSASVARGRLRASPWLKTPAGVPRLKTLASSPPRFPPCRNPFSRLRSKRGGFRRRPPQGGLRLSGGVPAPPLRGCVPAGTLRKENHRGTETAFLSLFINSPFRSPQIEGKTQGSVNRASLSVSNLTDSKFILDIFCNLC